MVGDRREFAGIEIRVLAGAAIQPFVEDMSRLRIEVFRDYPYLYDGDLRYEARYTEEFSRAPGAIIVGAFDEDRMIGAATGAPMAELKRDWVTPFEAEGYDLTKLFYCGESVLLADYRGRGIGHAFFDHREAQARRLGCDQICFAAVIRPNDHPLKPGDYRPLDPFWRKRGYRLLEGMTLTFSWKEVGQEALSDHALRVWIRAL